ncbi:hypothetical protein O181_120910 [Austropuccinia psidii MF-1]|uniref:TNFR-Cys domain-containing protein n=1 Tax=Austropuccinia psidii MF-1 TaxID=1389203 RepID=A0A9Q3Q1S7_9BASI|nr:hypothetical protein [Austropuccinia psidii MF-1]
MQLVKAITASVLLLNTYQCTLSSGRYCPKCVEELSHANTYTKHCKMPVTCNGCTKQVNCNEVFSQKVYRCDEPKCQRYFVDKEYCSDPHEQNIEACTKCQGAEATTATPSR